MSIIRVNLNLIYFFDDHRQLARIMIDDLKTVKDLQKYITRTFDIKKFYLMCDNHFLPPCTDIRVLSDNDIVLVVPSKKPSRDKKSCETLNRKDVSPAREIPDPINIVEAKAQSPPRKSAIKILEIRTIRPAENCRLTKCEQNDSKVENGVSPLNETESKRVKKLKNRSAVDKCPEIPPSAMDIAETKENNYCRNSALPQEPRKQTEEKPAARKEEINNEQASANKELGKSMMSDCAIDTPKSGDTNDGKPRSRGSKRSESLKCSGVGDVINLLNKTSDDLQDSSNAEDTSVKYVTKRRRHRIRSRKRKRTDNYEGEFDTSQSEKSVFRPPRTAANPLSHIMFADDEEFNSEQDMCEDDHDANTDAKKFAHSTPYNKQLINMHKQLHAESPVSPARYSNVCRKQEPPRQKIDISKATLVSLSKASAAVGSMVMFKRLKLANDYTPQISDYILAEVKELATVGNQLTLKVLEGHKEFEEPRGKFSCTTENGEEQDETFVAPLVEYVCLDKNALIDAKLVIFN